MSSIGYSAMIRIQEEQARIYNCILKKLIPLLYEQGDTELAQHVERHADFLLNGLTKDEKQKLITILKAELNHASQTYNMDIKESYSDDKINTLSEEIYCIRSIISWIK